MSRKEDILRTLSGTSEPMSRAVMVKKLGRPTSDWQTQLNSFENQGLVVKNDQKEYSLTTAGYEFLEEARRTHERLAEPGEGTPPGEAAIKERIVITINIFK